MVVVLNVNDVEKELVFSHISALTRFGLLIQLKFAVSYSILSFNRSHHRSNIGLASLSLELLYPY